MAMRVSQLSIPYITLHSAHKQLHTHIHIHIYSVLVFRCVVVTRGHHNISYHKQMMASLIETYSTKNRNESSLIRIVMSHKCAKENSKLFNCYFLIIRNIRCSLWSMHMVAPNYCITFFLPFARLAQKV